MDTNKMMFGTRRIFLSLLLLVHAHANAEGSGGFFEEAWKNEKIMKSLDEGAFTSGQGKYVFAVLNRTDYAEELNGGNENPEVILYKIENGKRHLQFHYPADGINMFAFSGDSGYQIKAEKGSLYVTH